MKIDQEKTSDKIDQKFLYKTMSKMGFSQTFINFIKILCKNNTSTIIHPQLLIMDTFPNKYRYNEGLGKVVLSPYRDT